MASSREIRQRIKSVKNIQHITKAMKMVAAARLRRAQERAESSKPFAQKIKEMLANVSAFETDVTHPLLQKREVKNIAYYIVGADKGLAGAYNSNVIKCALAEIAQHDNAHLVVVGRKVKEYFARRDYKIEELFEGFSEKPDYIDATAIARSMASKYISGEYDEINIVYTQFFSAINHKPIVTKVLPVEPPKSEDGVESKPGSGYIYEPSPAETLQLLVPRYLETVIYAGLMQSAASELGARMAAMSAATDNSSEIISKLTLYYNKIRQAGITSEINEIVGGAEALK